MAHIRIEDTEMFLRLKAYGHEVWWIVAKWPRFAQNTMGEQFVKATDSVCANLAEGEGRQSSADTLRFFVIARASLRESLFWLVTAYERELISRDDFLRMHDVVQSCGKMLSAMITGRRSKAEEGKVRESRGFYAGSAIEETSDEVETEFPTYDVVAPNSTTDS